MNRFFFHYILKLEFCVLKIGVFFQQLLDEMLFYENDIKDRFLIKNNRKMKSTLLLISKECYL